MIINLFKHFCGKPKYFLFGLLFSLKKCHVKWKLMIEFVVSSLFPMQLWLLLKPDISIYSAKGRKRCGLVTDFFMCCITLCTFKPAIHICSCFYAPRSSVCDKFFSNSRKFHSEVKKYCMLVAWLAILEFTVTVSLVSLFFLVLNVRWLLLFFLTTDQVFAVLHVLGSPGPQAFTKELVISPLTAALNLETVFSVPLPWNLKVVWTPESNQEPLTYMWHLFEIWRVWR